METRHTDPLAGGTPSVLREFGPDTELGCAARQFDAEHRLRQMEAAEQEVRLALERAAAIDSQIKSLNERTRIDLDYLVNFGVLASHREAFRKQLQQTVTDGQLTLRQAARRAMSESRRNNTVVQRR